MGLLEFDQSATSQGEMINVLSTKKSLISTAAIKRLGYKKVKKERKLKRRAGTDLEQFVKSIKRDDLEIDRRQNNEDSIYKNKLYSPEYIEQSSIISVIDQFEPKDSEELFRNLIRSMVQQDRILRLKITNPNIRMVEVTDDCWIDSKFSYRQKWRKPKEIKPMEKGPQMQNSEEKDEKDENSKNETRSDSVTIEKPKQESTENMTQPNKEKENQQSGTEVAPSNTKNGQSAATSPVQGTFLHVKYF